MVEKSWFDWSFDCKEASGQFLEGPGFVKKITLTSDGTNTSSVSLYDGHTTAGMLLVTLRTIANRTHSSDFAIPFHVVQGLYAEISANVECVSIQYMKDLP